MIPLFILNKTVLILFDLFNTYFICHGDQSLF